MPAPILSNSHSESRLLRAVATRHAALARVLCRLTECRYPDAELYGRHAAGSFIYPPDGYAGAHRAESQGTAA